VLPLTRLFLNLRLWLVRLMKELAIVYTLNLVYWIGWKLTGGGLFGFRTKRRNRREECSSHS
jgi:hypothetical protein